MAVSSVVVHGRVVAIARFVGIVYACGQSERASSAELAKKLAMAEIGDVVLDRQ